ncbi:hypothetical protein CH272_28085 [Rhodococcus sp. 05-340-1]|uniref:antibiotic biosynthesis monooxygenase n=1 Tax=unclassified Rhodococcus (in: high G+C Gram-positive bacteria) TaxID=192944 RepID=UPI000B9BF093|nr:MULTISPECIES: antibiotic biosynthesis monooxygenase [unclassified Rhodococcus (in: high G+C Gram-positive bacteria)]OZD68871.1 hypothetical protein CH271_10805 [Rhodococcus sp. 05-340-2]OZD69344.1 hypothetical protein CH272_28085 [Rhodococcus sp. 05-340-1]
MAALRVIHQLRAGDSQESDLLEYTHRLRKQDGCTEAEHFRSLTDPEHVAVLELWDDEFAFGNSWAQSLSEQNANVILRAAAAQPQGESGTEFYRHQGFLPGERSWTPIGRDVAEQKIVWPAAGSVRIVIQQSQHDLDAAVDALISNRAETLREPGCVTFDFFRGTEFPDDMLLLEVWHDQAVYDAHWAMRIRTGSVGGGGEPSPREHGTNGFEFYRQQRFVHLYDRWFPADVSNWSEAVVWAD